MKENNKDIIDFSLTLTIRSQPNDLNQYARALSMI